MKTIYKILNYDGPIHTLRRWTHELLAYSFTCAHQHNTMMQDVDALSRYQDPLVAEHTVISNQYQQQDTVNCKATYSSSVFDKLLKANKYAINNTNSFTNKRAL